MIFVRIENTEGTRLVCILAQMWQNLKRIKSLAKEQFQQHNSINNELMIFQEQNVVAANLLDLQHRQLLRLPPRRVNYPTIKTISLR